MRKPIRSTVPAAGVAAALLLAGCSGQAAPAPDADAPVKITVSNMPPADRAEERALFEQRLAEFEKANPNITVEGTETVWDPSGFQALIAGGQMPTVLAVPFTEPQSLINRKQIADISAELKDVGLLDELNPAALEVVQDADGKTYGVPIDAYALGLVYNRSLFEKVGLDPDSPPATWDEVRDAAKAIADATGVAGYAQMTQGGTGGWMLGATTYSRGGALVDESGDKSAFDDDPTAEQLELLSSMRFQDSSMGANTLYDMTSISQDFAAGKIGMFVGAPANYIFAVVLNGMSPDDFAMGPMPQGEDAGGTMSGGTAQVVSPKATAQQRLAAAKWIAFTLENKTDEKKAIAEAETAAAQKLPVGLPGLPSFKEQQYEEYLGWVKDQINVPLENFAPYTETVNTIELTPEPPKKAQEIYAALDATVQAVLTDQSADIPALLEEAAGNVDALLKR